MTFPQLNFPTNTAGNSYEFYRLSVLALPPKRFTYFRVIESLPFFVLLALWMQGAFTWTNASFALLALTGFYTITPWILNLQRHRLTAELARKLTLLEKQIAKEADPVKRQWLKRQVSALPEHYHLAVDPEPTYERFELLAQLTNCVRRICDWISRH
ncbi:hypothetical protein FQZ97_977480 [compost metagenome]